MAIFNPQIPDTNDPNYLGYSHPISQPQADQSMEALFKGVGDVFATAVKGADISVKKVIDLKAEQAYKERDEYTEALKFGSTVVAGEIPTSAKYGQSTTDPGATTSLTDDKGNILGGEGDTEELPPDLENLPASLDTLQGARAGGRISPTQYHGRLAALAKSLRSEFPGYKDYVDKEISRITGVDPANAYIRSMIADINSFAVKKATSDTRTLALLYKNIEFPGSPALIEAVKAGVPGAETKALVYVNAQLSKKYEYENKKLVNDNLELDDKEKANNASKIFTDRVKQLSADSFDTVLNVGGVTPKRVEDAIRSGPLPPTEALKLAQGLTQHILADKLRMQNEARIGAPGTTHVDRLGAERVNKIIEDSFKGREEIVRYLHQGEIAPAHMLATQNKAMGDQNTNAMLTDSEIGPFMLDIQTMHGMGPAVMNQLAILGLVNDYPMKYKAWVDRGRVGAAVGSPKLDGTPRTLNGTMNEIQQEALKDKAVLTPTIARKFINQVLSITDPKLPDEFKKKQIDYAFGREGLGLISKIQRDSIDPVSGVATAGQYSLYKELASKDMLNTSFRLGGTSWTKHKEWTLGTFAAELFTPAIKELNNIQMSPGMRLRYDNERHEFRIDPKGYSTIPQFGTPAPSSNMSSMGHAQMALDRLNGAIASVAHVHKLEGRDVNSTILSGLRHLGFDPSIASPQGIPEHMIKAIVQEREERKRQEEETKKRLRAN